MTSVCLSVNTTPRSHKPTTTYIIYILCICTIFQQPSNWSIVRLSHSGSWSAIFENSILSNKEWGRAPPIIFPNDVSGIIHSHFDRIQNSLNSNEISEINAFFTDPRMSSELIDSVLPLSAWPNRLISRDIVIDLINNGSYLYTEFGSSTHQTGQQGSQCFAGDIEGWRHRLSRDFRKLRSIFRLRRWPSDITECCNIRV